MGVGIGIFPKWGGMGMSLFLKIPDYAIEVFQITKSLLLLFSNIDQSCYTDVLSCLMIWTTILSIVTQLFTSGVARHF